MDSETIITMDEAEKCGDYTVTQEWLVKEDGTRTLMEEVVEPRRHKWKRVCTMKGGPWGPAEYDDVCSECGATK